MRLRYTRPAAADLASILEYIAERSPWGVKRVQARIRAVTNLLLRYPLAGTMTGDPAIRRKTTTPHPYVIFYEVNDDEVIIHAVRHGARDSYNSPGLHEDSHPYEPGDQRSVVQGSQARASHEDL
jgi:plasmid stabilization system protein ParE